jgi:hypothetical protein
MLDFIGAPEEIRTPDPQIRSLTVAIEAAYEIHSNCHNQTAKGPAPFGLVV